MIRKRATGICTTTTILNKVEDSLETSGVLHDAQVVGEGWYGPDGDVAHVGLCEEVEEFGDGAGEYIAQLKCPVLELTQHKLLHPMTQQQRMYHKWVRNHLKLLSIVHKRYHPIT